MAYAFTVSPYGVSPVVRHYVLFLRMLLCYQLLYIKKCMCLCLHICIYMVSKGKILWQNQDVCIRCENVKLAIVSQIKHSFSL